MKKSTQYTKHFTVGVFCFILFLLSSQGVSAQGFSSVDSDLQQVEDLIKYTIANTQEQEKLLHDLRQNLAESGNLIASYETIISEQEKLLQDLQAQLKEMSETYKQRSDLSGKSEQKLKFWRTFTIVGIPVTAVISGLVVWAIVQ